MKPAAPIRRSTRNTAGTWAPRFRLEPLATGESLDGMPLEVQVSYLIETRSHPAFTREVLDVPLSARLTALGGLRRETLLLVKTALENSPEREEDR